MFKVPAQQKSGTHSRDGTTFILLSKFSKMGCTMLGDEFFSRVYQLVPLTPVAGSNLLEKKVLILGTFPQNSEFLELFQVMSK